MSSVEYVQRSLDPVIDRLFAELPALFLVGPRAGGKTTTAARRASTVVRLDKESTAAAVRSDPDAFLAALEEPVLIDGWHVVPDVLGAVKRSVDENPSPGRFLVTGSVRAAAQPAVWPGTGRLTRLTLHGMSIAEQLGVDVGRGCVHRVVERGADVVLPRDPPDIRGYVTLGLRSGFPEAALRLSDDARDAWLSSYVDQLVSVDVAQLDGHRDQEALRRYLQAYAVSSAGLVDEMTLAGAADVNRRTAKAYESIFAELFAIEGVPAWATNRLKRLTRARKRYLTDPAMWAMLVHADAGTIGRDGDLLGRFLDTFVMAQLRVDLQRMTPTPRVHHVRTEQGRREVDLVVELGGERVVGIEIKATAAPGAGDARHLVWLREQMGDRFVAGIVFHTGPYAFTLGDRIHALPICSLWSPDTA